MRMTAVVNVKAESLTKRFGELSAATDLSFALEAGTITGLLGRTALVSRRPCG
jgi:ABC-type multidrug transport system ATPase subunit